MTIWAKTLLLTTLVLLSGAPANAQTVIRLAANERLAEQWVAQRLLQAVYAKAGVAMQVDPIPAARANLEAIQGRRDGEVARIAAYGDRNPSLIRVATPYYYLTTVAFSLKARAAAVKQRSDLQHYSVGALRGVAHSSEATESHPAVTQTQSPEQMFRMLTAGRFDLALDTGINGRYVVARLGLKDIDASPDLARLDLYHYLHSRHKDLALRLDGVIRQMQASGELDKLKQQAEADLLGISIESFSSKP